MSSAACYAGPYAESREVKEPQLLAELNELTAWHAARCPAYRRILHSMYAGVTVTDRMEDLPYLPVALFKSIDLVSVPPGEVVKTMTSSGTSSQQPSKVFLDKTTAQRQARALASIMKAFLGSHRLPMAIIDHPGVLKDRKAFSARGAAILGFSQFGRDHVYLLNERMELDWDVLKAFRDRHFGEKLLLFGFTFLVWQNLVEAATRIGRKVDLGNSILIHGGGWKKLADRAVSSDQFRARFAEMFGTSAVHNYYGMVEQTGSIFMECEKGNFHSSRYSDVLIRDPVTLEVLPNGKPGILQLMSNIPRSYPGHVLLSEDVATITGEDTCACTRMGKLFQVHGRLASAEIRGCSDTQVG